MGASFKPLIAAILLCGSLQATGQSEKEALVPLRVLTVEVCGCISTIPSEVNSQELGSALRECLEQAVIRHPKEVRELIRENDSELATGYYLGRVIGRSLEKDCVRFRSIKRRIGPDGEASIQGGLS